MLKENYGQFVSMTIWPMDVHQKTINKLQLLSPQCLSAISTDCLSAQLVVKKHELADAEAHFVIYRFESINSIINLEISLFWCWQSAYLCLFLYPVWWSWRGAEIVPPFKWLCCELILINNATDFDDMHYMHIILKALSPVFSTIKSLIRQFVLFIMSTNKTSVERTGKNQLKAWIFTWKKIPLNERCLCRPKMNRRYAKMF